MKLKTIVGIGVVAAMTMLMGVVANAATTFAFGTPSISGTDVEVPLYLKSNDVKNFGAYDTDVTFDISKMTFDGSENKLVKDTGRGALGDITEDTSKASTGRVGIIWNSSGADKILANGSIQVASLYFVLNDTSMTADDILADLAVRQKNLAVNGRQYPGTYGTYVTFTMDKDFVPTTTNKYIVGMALDIDGTQYSEADGTLKYTEDTDGNYVFTVTMKPSAKTTANVKLIGKVAATEDGTDTTDFVINDFGTVQIDVATPFAD